MSELHGPCAEVGRELSLSDGQVPSADDLLLLAHSGVASALAEEVALRHGYQPGLPRVGADESNLRDLGWTDGIIDAINELGCRNCEIRDECPVADAFLSGASDRSLLARFTEYVYQLEHPMKPGWLKVARTNITNMPSNVLDPDCPEQSVDPGMAIAGIEVVGRRIVARANLPEIAHIVGIEDAELVEHEIVTANSDRFAVVDISGLHASADKDRAPEVQEANLLGKFLQRLISRDGLGRPHIFSPDSTWQKLIQNMKDGVKLYEIRKAGKNRLYITLNANAEPTRIIILGSHGGDTATQQRFIARVTVD